MAASMDAHRPLVDKLQNSKTNIGAIEVERAFSNKLTHPVHSKKLDRACLIEWMTSMVSC